MFHAQILSLFILDQKIIETLIRKSISNSNSVCITENQIFYFHNCTISDYNCSDRTDQVFYLSYVRNIRSIHHSHDDIQVCHDAQSSPNQTASDLTYCHHSLYVRRRNTKPNRTNSREPM